MAGQAENWSEPLNFHELEFMEFLVELSSRFINLPAGEIDTEIYTALRMTGEKLNVDRCYVFLFNHDLSTMSNTHEWCAEGIEPQLPNLQEVQTADFPGWMNPLVNNQDIYIPDVTALKPEDQALKEVLAGQSIASLLVSPMTYSGRLIGYLGWDSVKKKIQLTPHHVHILRLVGNILASALIRKQTENALQESEAKFRALSETAATAIFIYQGPVFVYVNPMACELTGYPAKELLTMNFWDVVHPEYRETVMQRGLARQRGEKVPSRYEFVIRTKTGETRWLDFTSGVIQFGGRTAALGTAFDITERKLAEDALIKSEMLYRELFDHATDIIYLHDLKGNLLSINKTGENLIGYSREELSGKSLASILPKEYVELVRRMTTRQIFLDLPTLIYEIELITRKGETIPLELNTRLLYRDGEPVAVQGIARDITERKKADLALSAEKDRLAITLKSIGDAVISTDPEGRIILFNEMAEQLTGWHHADAIGRQITDVTVLVNELTGQPEENPVSRILKSEAKSLKDSGLCLISRDGSRFIVADSAAEVTDSDGNRIGTVLVLRDITDRRKIQAERLKNQKIESLGILAGGIAHDFNNFLTAILGNISLTRLSLEKHQTDRMELLLREAESATLKARELTRQLLTFSKGGTPVKQTASITDLLKDTAAFILRGTGCLLETDIDPALSPAEVDEGQISQVVNNLILNAVQAMPGGGTVTLKADTILMDSESARILSISPGRYIRIQIADQGTGISPEHLSNIFDPYFTTKKMGSGLGLATSYSIIKKHDGAISVTSEPGAGTEFTVYLPASEKPFSPRTEQENPAGTHSPGRILVMDDEQMIRNLLSEILTYLGFEVVTVTNGDEAIEAYRVGKNEGSTFSLVIMDMTIPGGKGGRETITELRKIDPDVKALVSSGYANDPVLSDYKAYGFAGILAKPYRVEDLSAIISEVLKP